MSKQIFVVAAVSALAALCARGARAELIELTNGQVLQGDVKESQSTEDGLAVDVYETGGVVIVRWDHVAPSQRRELRLKIGIDLPEESVVLVDGHRVILTDGTKVEGIALNPRATNEPLRMKTRSGVKEYERASLAGPVEDVKIDGLLVNTPDELFQSLRDKDPPETSAAHKALALSCMNFGAYDHAKEQLLACKSDAVFMATDEGKAVDSMLRQCDLMIRAKGASDLAVQIRQAMGGNRWNDALNLLNQLDKDPNFKDEGIRKEIRFDILESRVVRGRDAWFQKEISKDVYKVFEQLVGEKAHEKKPLRDPADDPNAKPGSVTPGTLASAKQWITASGGLTQQLWDKVASDLQLSKDDIEKYWKSRFFISHRSSYGTGSFIVVTRATTPPKPGGPTQPTQPQRRPPGSQHSSGKKDSGKNAPPPADKVEKPLTEEEWWDSIQSPDKKAWLMAYFAERGGYFEVVATPQVNCERCQGLGLLKSVGAQGDDNAHFCPTCNGCGLVRSVTFR